jgi:hypothetical protein
VFTLTQLLSPNIAVASRRREKNLPMANSLTTTPRPCKQKHKEIQNAKRLECRTGQFLEIENDDLSRSAIYI